MVRFLQVENPKKFLGYPGAGGKRRMVLRGGNLASCSILAISAAAGGPDVGLISGRGGMAPTGGWIPGGMAPGAATGGSGARGGIGGGSGAPRGGPADGGTPRGGTADFLNGGGLAMLRSPQVEIKRV
jgi:hypothetical protein